MIFDVSLLQKFYSMNVLNYTGIVNTLVLIILVGLGAAFFFKKGKNNDDTPLDKF